MSERYYAVYLRNFGDSVEVRVRGYHHRRLGPPRTLANTIEGASRFDNDVPVTIVTVVE